MLFARTIAVSVARALIVAKRFRAIRGACVVSASWKVVCTAPVARHHSFVANRDWHQSWCKHAVINGFKLHDIIRCVQPRLIGNRGNKIDLLASIWSLQAQRHWSLVFEKYVLHRADANGCARQGVSALTFAVARGPVVNAIKIATSVFCTAIPSAVGAVKVWQARAAIRRRIKITRADAATAQRGAHTLWSIARHIVLTIAQRSFKSRLAFAFAITCAATSAIAREPVDLRARCRAIVTNKQRISLRIRVAPAVSRCARHVAALALAAFRVALALLVAVGTKVISLAGALRSVLTLAVAAAFVRAHLARVCFHGQAPPVIAIAVARSVADTVPVTRQVFFAKFVALWREKVFYAPVAITLHLLTLHFVDGEARVVSCRRRHATHIAQGAIPHVVAFAA